MFGWRVVNRLILTSYLRRPFGTTKKPKAASDKICNQFPCSNTSSACSTRFARYYLSSSWRASHFGSAAIARAMAFGTAPNRCATRCSHTVAKYDSGRSRPRRRGSRRRCGPTPAKIHRGFTWDSTADSWYEQLRRNPKATGLPAILIEAPAFGAA